MATANEQTRTNGNSCQLCKKALAKYCCPRCNVLYCSLTCYQSMNHLHCSEAFYKDCIKEEGLIIKDEDVKTKMMEIIKRVHETNEELPEGYCNIGLDSDDDGDYEELSERLAGVNLDDAELVWSKLNSDERQQFEAFLRSSDISKILPKWEPWWSFYTNKKVLDISETNEYKTKSPKIKEDVKDIFTLLPKYPSVLTKFNIINSLTAYVFMTRYFNGEYRDFAREASSTVTNLALSLKINHNFEDILTAVESVHHEIMNSTWIKIDEENITNMRDDIHHILRGPCRMDKKYYIFSALSDLYSLIECAIKVCSGKTQGDFTKKFPDSQFPVVLLESKDKLKRHLKKIDFYLAYVKDCWSH